MFNRITDEATLEMTDFGALKKERTYLTSLLLSKKQLSLLK